MRSKVDKIINWKNIQMRFRYILENLKDESLKNMKIVNFIRDHALFLSIIIILLGIANFYVASTNIDKTTQNTIIINTNEAKGVKYNGDNKILIQLDKSALPFSMQIDIYVDYKIPVMYGSDMILEKICISPKRSSWSEGFTANLNDFDLSVDNGKPGYSTNKGFNFANFHQNNLTNLTSLTCYQYSDYLIFAGPNTNNEYNFSYNLQYTDDENQRFNLKGIANLEKPIKAANEVDEMNIRINKSILFLTGWLIILGSLPFCISLKQLLDKK